MSDKYGWIQGGNGDFNSVSACLPYLFRTLYSALFILHSLQQTVFLRPGVRLRLLSDTSDCPTPNMESDTSPKYSSFFTLYSLFFFLSPCNIVCCMSQYTAYCILHTAHSTVYSIQYTVYSIQYTVYSIPHTVHTIHYTLYSIQYTVYTIQYTVYSIQYIV